MKHYNSNNSGNNSHHHHYHHQSYPNQNFSNSSNMNTNNNNNSSSSSSSSSLGNTMNSQANTLHNYSNMNKNNSNSNNENNTNNSNANRGAGINHQNMNRNNFYNNSNSNNNNNNSNSNNTSSNNNTNTYNPNRNQSNNNSTIYHSNNPNIIPYNQFLPNNNQHPYFNTNIIFHNSSFAQQTQQKHFALNQSHSNQYNHQNNNNNNSNNLNRQSALTENIRFNNNNNNNGNHNINSNNYNTKQQNNINNNNNHKNINTNSSVSISSSSSCSNIINSTNQIQGHLNSPKAANLPHKTSIDSLISIDENKNDLSNESIEIKESKELNDDDEVFEKSVDDLKQSVSELCILSNSNETSSPASIQSPLPSSPSIVKLADIIKEENNFYDKTEYFRNLVVTIDRLYPEVKWPLHNTWTFGYIKNTPNINWAENIKQIADVSYVEDFWSVVTKLFSPTMMTSIGDLTFFKKGIMPMWEDTANKNGGSWLLVLSGQQLKYKQDIDEYWMETLLALIGDNFCGDNPFTDNSENTNEHLCDLISGAYVSYRGKAWKLALWTKNYKDDRSTRLIGKIWKYLLKLNEIVTITFEAHETKNSKNANFKIVYKE